MFDRLKEFIWQNKAISGLIIGGLTALISFLAWQNAGELFRGFIDFDQGDIGIQTEGSQETILDEDDLLIEQISDLVNQEIVYEIAEFFVHGPDGRNTECFTGQECRFFMQLEITGAPITVDNEYSIKLNGVSTYIANNQDLSEFTRIGDKLVNEYTFAGTRTFFEAEEQDVEVIISDEATSDTITSKTYNFTPVAVPDENNFVRIKEMSIALLNEQSQRCLPGERCHYELSFDKNGNSPVPSGVQYVVFLDGRELGRITDAHRGQFLTAQPFEVENYRMPGARTYEPGTYEINYQILSNGETLAESEKQEVIISAGEISPSGFSFTAELDFAISLETECAVGVPCSLELNLTKHGAGATDKPLFYHLRVNGQGYPTQEIFDSFETDTPTSILLTEEFTPETRNVQVEFELYEDRGNIREGSDPFYILDQELTLNLPNTPAPANGPNDQRIANEFDENFNPLQDFEDLQQDQIDEIVDSLNDFVNPEPGDIFNNLPGPDDDEPGFPEINNCVQRIAVLQATISRQDLTTDDIERLETLLAGAQSECAEEIAARPDLVQRIEAVLADLRSQLPPEDPCEALIAQADSFLANLDQLTGDDLPAMRDLVIEMQANSCNADKITELQISIDSIQAQLEQGAQDVCTELERQALEFIQNLANLDDNDVPTLEALHTLLTDNSCDAATAAQLTGLIDLLKPDNNTPPGGNNNPPNNNPNPPGRNPDPPNRNNDTDNDDDDDDDDNVELVSIEDLELSTDRLNPLLNDLRISFELSKRGKVDVEIIDPDGDQVLEIISRKTLSGGDHFVFWNGTDEVEFDGDVVDLGIYTIKVTARDPETSVKTDVKSKTVQVAYQRTANNGFPPNGNTGAANPTPPDQSDQLNNANNSSGTLNQNQVNPIQTAATVAIQNATTGQTAETGPGILIYMLAPLLGYAFVRIRRD